MTSPLRRALSTPGALAFSATGLLARMPMSMVSLGIILLVSARTGSYATAGGISAAYVGATAVGAVPLARLVDRLGQGRVLGVATSLACVALALLVVAVEQDWPLPVPHLLAVCVGAAMPNIGAAVRERWAHAVQERPLLDAAFAVEAVNDEMVFIIGPTLTTLLAATVHPVAGLVAAGLAALVGTWLLVAQRATEPPRHAGHSSVERAAMPWARLAPQLVGSVALGALFGGCEVAVVAFADEAGSKGAAGPLLAVWALGSLLAGAVSANVTFRQPAEVRYKRGLLSLALLMTPLPFVSGFLTLGAFLFLAGFAISPTLIAAVSWIEQLVPSTRLNEGMTVFTSGLVAGVAAGSAAVGVMVDALGASPAFWVPAAAGLLGAGAAYLTAPARLQEVR